MARRKCNFKGNGSFKNLPAGNTRAYKPTKREAREKKEKARRKRKIMVGWVYFPVAMWLVVQFGLLPGWLVVSLKALGWVYSLAFTPFGDLLVDWN